MITFACIAHEGARGARARTGCRLSLAFVAVTPSRKGPSVYRLLPIGVLERARAPAPAVRRRSATVHGCVQRSGRAISVQAGGTLCVRRARPSAVWHPPAWAGGIGRRWEDEMITLYG